MSTPIYPSPSTPVHVARQYLDTHYTEKISYIGCEETRAVQTIGHWRDDWMTYTGTCWQSMGSSEDAELTIRGNLYNELEDAVYEVSDDNDGTTTKSWNPTPARVASVTDVVKTKAHLLLPDSKGAPFWLNDYEDALPAEQYVAMANGLLHLPSRRLESHTPELFATWSLPFDYDPEANCPQWLRFLDVIFAHDPKAKMLLQEYAGYLISGRMDLHKALVIVGPARAGKGTIVRAITELLGGERNVATPTLHTLGSEFGRADLIGKPLAVIADARGDGGQNANQITETLLNIIGEDAVSINRKYRPHWNGTLPTRFLVASNEVPRFLDASGAVVSRFMSMKLELSFAGREDLDLGARINREMSGVYNWALEGLDRLERQGKLTTPNTMADMIEAMNAYAAPIAEFVKDHYVITGSDDDQVPRPEIYKEYTWWCGQNGIRASGMNKFSSQMQAGDARIKERNLRQETGKRQRFITGIKKIPTA